LICAIHTLSDWSQWCSSFTMLNMLKLSWCRDRLETRTFELFITLNCRALCSNVFQLLLHINWLYICFCSRESMCRDCVVSECFIAYNKAQIDKLSAAVAEMAIAPSDPNVRYVCLIHLAVTCCYSLVSWQCDVFTAHSYSLCFFIKFDSCQCWDTTLVFWVSQLLLGR